MALHYLLALVVILMLSSTYAQSPPVPLSTAAREFLLAHNQARAAVGVPPLYWSQQLAVEASRIVQYQQDYSCQLAKFITTYPYGQNQVRATGMAVTPLTAVDKWMQNKQYYSYWNNSCTAYPDCVTYTNVVWKNTLELGCAQGFCVGQTSLIICLYNPSGDVREQRPY